jgi:hypothetical protein
MGRVVAILGGVLVLALMAGVLTEAALARGHRGGVGEDAVLLPTRKAAVVSPTPTPTVVPTPVATAAPTPAPTPAAPTAVTNSFVHMRSSNSFTAPILYDLNGGTVVRVLPGGDAQWQAVEYSGQSGYIFKTYLTYN